MTATKIEVFNCAWSPSNTMYLSLLVYRSFTNGVSAKRARARVHSLWPNYMNWKHDQSAKAKMENYFVCYFAWTVKSHNSNTHSHTHTNERSNVRALSNVFFFFFFCDCLFHSGDFELRNGMEWNEGTAEKKTKTEKINVKTNEARALYALTLRVHKLGGRGGGVHRFQKYIGRRRRCWFWFYY